MSLQVKCLFTVVIHTNDCIQGEGALSEDFFVACDSGALLTSFPVQVSQHHVDLRREKTITSISSKQISHLQND